MLILLKITGGQIGGGADEGAGEVEGDHRGARADLRRDVWLLSHLKMATKSGLKVASVRLRSPKTLLCTSGC